MPARFCVLTACLSIGIVTLVAGPSFAEISVETLTKETAKEKYGITMHTRKNGDAGIKVWLEFRNEGWLEKLSYTEFRMQDTQGKHLASVVIQPSRVSYFPPSKDVTSVELSAAPDHLKQCSFLLVCKNNGDGAYYLHVKDFLDLENPVTEK